MFTSRDARPEDIPKLVALLEQLYTIEPRFTPDPVKQRKGIELCLAHRELCRIIVVERGPELVGMANIQFTVSTANGAMSIHIDDFIIHEDHRSLGAGRCLIEALMRVAGQIGATSVTVNVDVTNDPALAFYRDMGFECMDLMRFRRLLNS